MDSKEEELKKVEAAQVDQDSKTDNAISDSSNDPETAVNDVLSSTNDAQNLPQPQHPVIGLPDDPAALPNANSGPQPVKPPLPLKSTPGKPPKMGITTTHGATASHPSTLSPSHTQGERAQRATASAGGLSGDLSYAITANMTNMLERALSQMTMRMDQNNELMEQRFAAQVRELRQHQDHTFDAITSNHRTNVNNPSDRNTYRPDADRDLTTNMERIPPPPLHGTPPPVVRVDRNHNDLRNEIAEMEHHLHHLNQRPPAPRRPIDHLSLFEHTTDRRPERPLFETSYDDQRSHSSTTHQTPSNQRFHGTSSGQHSQSPAAATTNVNRQILNSSQYPLQQPAFSARQSAGQSFRLDGRAPNGHQNYNQRVDALLRDHERSAFVNGYDPSDVTPEDERSGLRGQIPAQYGMSRAVEHAIRSLNPCQSLHASLRNPVKLGKPRTTYQPWCSYWNNAFNTCYLNCLVYIDPRHAPTQRDEWARMDREAETIAARRATVQLLQSGTTPNPTRDDSVLQLTGILLGVVDVFPQLSPILVNGMRESLEEGSLAHIRDEDQSDVTSLRTMYFGAHMQFLSPLNDARESALLDFMTNTKYKMNMSPLEFLDKTLLKAKEVDKLYQSKQITDSQVWTIVLRAVRETVASLYDGCIDRFRTDPGYSENRPETLREIFQVMDTKYKEQKRSADEPYAMVVHDNETPLDETSSYLFYVGRSMEAANFAGNGHKGAKNAGQRRKTSKLPSSLTSQNAGEKKDLPCFAFQRNGSCDYPNCKYSHDPLVIAKAPPPPEKGTFIGMLLDDAAEKSAAYTELAAALVKAKKDVKRLNKFKKKVMKGKSGETGSTYQSVIKGGAKANALVPYVPDGNPPSATIQNIVTDDDESDNDDQHDTTDDSITDDSQE